MENYERLDENFRFSKKCPIYFVHAIIIWIEQFLHFRSSQSDIYISEMIYGALLYKFVSNIINHDDDDSPSLHTISHTLNLLAFLMRMPFAFIPYKVNNIGISFCVSMKEDFFFCCSAFFLRSYLIDQYFFLPHSLILFISLSFFFF